MKSFEELQLARIWNTLLSAGDKLLGLEHVMARPLKIHLEINDFCNLKCPHCPRENPDIPKNTGHIPLEAIKKLEPWFRKANYVGLTGNGEPFLHPEIMEIFETIISAGATPSTTSNATLWKRLGVIEKLPSLGPMLINVSVDGGTKATFEKWRKRANFDEVRENLLALRRAKEAANSPFPVVNFISVLMKETIGEVVDIVDWAGEAGVQVIVFQNMYPYNKFMDDMRVKDVDECRRAIAAARERAKRYGIRIDWLPMSVDVDERGSEGGQYGEITAETAERKSRGEEKAERLAGGKVRYHCDNVWNQVHVTVSGDIKFCCFWTDGPVGNLLDTDFGDIWNGEEWTALRRDMKNGVKRGPCRDCHNLVTMDRRKILRASMRELKDLVNR